MRLRRPIAFILSAAVAASALTGCDSFSGHAAAAANSAQVQQLIEFIADLGLERDLRQALQSGGDLRQALLTLLGLENAVNFNVDGLTGARPGQHAVQVWEVTAQSAEDAAALAASQIRAVLEQLRSNGVTEGRIGMVEVDGKYYVVVDVEVTEENTFEPIRPASDDDDNEDTPPVSAPTATMNDGKKIDLSSLGNNISADEILKLAGENYNRDAITALDLSGYTGLESIGDGAFGSCTSLASIDLSDCTNLQRIGNSAFQNCASLETITLSSTVNTIGTSAFGGCSRLTSIDLPANLQTIGNSAFLNCTDLTSIDLPAGLITIGNSAFRDCGGLTSIDLPAGLQNIDDNAFAGCSGLTSITLPAKLTTIGNYAFYNCSGLENIYFYGVPTTIETDAFFGVNTDVIIHCLNGKTSALQEKLKASGLDLTDEHFIDDLTPLTYLLDL